MPPLNLPYSHYVLTGEQCREADKRTIEGLGIDGFTLMETAGIQAAGFIGSLLACLAGRLHGPPKACDRACDVQSLKVLLGLTQRAERAPAWTRDSAVAAG
jgi:hypothetical protein